MLSLNIDTCRSCKCIGSYAKYSNWEYCTNPNNFREFAIIRWRCDL